MNASITLDKLQGLIGNRLEYHGHTYQVIEVLADGPSLVLEYIDKIDHAVIQADLHGEAHRRVPETVTIPILNANSEEFSLEFLNLNLLDVRA